jgi:hypothetical protein
MNIHSAFYAKGQILVYRSEFVRVMEYWKSHGFLFCKIKAFKSREKLLFEL